ncbi:uncharacterized protein LOC119359388 [Triticum dicoccoides]|uniref:uncharacterized protein LOC119359388 n=1 Tax=Triticum dicoccoides TaxID=85692 RepID=UPI00188DDCB3|nr:uncharacterized protein LOC119359388 [Triticum dicoccoides]
MWKPYYDYTPSAKTFGESYSTAIRRPPSSSIIDLGVLPLELVSVQQPASGTPSSLTRAEALQCMTKDRAARPNMSSVATKVYKLFLKVQDCANKVPHPRQHVHLYGTDEFNLIACWRMCHCFS